MISLAWRCGLLMGLALGASSVVYPQSPTEREIVAMRATTGGVGALHIRLANVSQSVIDSEATLTIGVYRVGGGPMIGATPIDLTTGRHYPPPGKREHRLTLAVGEVRTLVVEPARLLWVQSPGTRASDELRDSVLSGEFNLHAMLAFHSGGLKVTVIGPIRLRMAAQ